MKHHTHPANSQKAVLRPKSNTFGIFSFSQKAVLHLESSGSFLLKNKSIFGTYLHLSDNISGKHRQTILVLAKALLKDIAVALRIIFGMSPGKTVSEI